MKSLILLSVIVGFLLEDHVRGSEELQVFKDHASKLVNAAYMPFYNSREIRELGRQCQPIVKDMTVLNTFNLIIATMSIAQQVHRNYLVRIRDNDVSRVRSEIPQNTLQKMFDIVHELEVSTEDFRLVPLDDVKILQEDYFLDPPCVAKVSERLNTDNTVELLTKCYRLLVIIYNNDQFFNSLLRGFSIERQLLKMERHSEMADSENRTVLSTELQTIVDALHGYSLTIPQSNLIANQLNNFVAKVTERYRNVLNDKISDLTMPALVFFTVVAACVTGLTFYSLLTR